MAKRKVGNNKRQPRASGPASGCISIMPDGAVTMFHPRKKKSHVSAVKLPDGSWIMATKERALR